MQVVNLIQGSPEWHAHRGEHFNASDAPAMMGESKYKTRDQLLHEMATGLKPEVDNSLQRRFDEGHDAEAKARPLAEQIIGDELSPTVGTIGKLSASFDGITFAGDAIFEHKLLNDDLRTAFQNRDLDTVELPIMYRIQMEQQLYISGAERCLFMATKWNGNELAEPARQVWYWPDLELREKIISCWEQFEKDLAAYVPPVQVEKLEAKVVESLPVPSVVVKGEMVSCNLNEITPHFDTYLANINTTLSTDQDFADAEVEAKNCRDMAKKLDSVTEAIIAQMGDINTAISVLGEYSQKLNKMGLQLEKAVKDQKESVKTAAILKAKQDYADFVSGLQAGLPITLHQVLQVPDFAGAIKGIKTIASMQSRINDALAQGKAAATTAANDIKVKSEYIKEASKGYEHLINSASIVTRDMDYIKLHIQSVKDQEDQRKAAHEAEIKAKAEAEARAKIEAEQRAKELAEEQAIIDARSAQQINGAKPEVAEREATPSGQDQVSENKSSLATILLSVYSPLFEHMANEHGLNLLESELQEIVRISVLVNDRMHQNSDLFEAAA